MGTSQRGVMFWIGSDTSTREGVGGLKVTVALLKGGDGRDTTCTKYMRRSRLWIMKLIPFPGDCF